MRFFKENPDEIGVDSAGGGWIQPDGACVRRLIGRRMPRYVAFLRVVSFLREPCGTSLFLPPETDGARILAVSGREVFTAYVPSHKGPVFMKLIEKTFGEAVTTRTWDTVKKCSAA